LIGKKLPRIRITPAARQEALDAISRTLEWRLDQKGPLSYTSSHEVLGIITEEYLELIDAVKANDRAAIIRELHDIGVAAIFGVASAEEGGFDW
jgi:NTP pyrophosphatase (non-canonical NTP hydrolase)